MARLDAIGIVCKDIEASLRFYALLGIETPSEYEGPHVEVELPGGLRLMFDSLELIKSIVPDWESPVGIRMSLAFLCDSPEDVDATYARIVAAGHTGKSEPWDAFWGQRYAQVIDPDGNVVDLFASL